MHFFIELLIYVVPCWIINTALNVFQFIPILSKIDRPFDFDINFLDKRPILGKSTTLVGFFVALGSGVLVELFFTNWQIGLIKGFTVFFGHALGSFIKRRLNIPNGGYVPIVDHGDYVILTGLVFFSMHIINLELFLCSIPLTLIVHPILCYIGYNLKLRKSPY